MSRPQHFLTKMSSFDMQSDSDGDFEIVNMPEVSVGHVPGSGQTGEQAPSPPPVTSSPQQMVNDINSLANPEYISEVRYPEDERVVVPMDISQFREILEQEQLSGSDNDYMSNISSQASSVAGGHYLRHESSHSLHVSSQESFSGMYSDSYAGSQPNSFAVPTQEPLPRPLSQPVPRDHEAPSSQTFTTQASF